MMNPDSAGAVTRMVYYHTSSSTMLLPVMLVPRDARNSRPFGGLFPPDAFDDLPAPTADYARGTKRGRDGAPLALLQLKEVAAADQEDECAICLNGFRAEDTVRAMPACAHAFHHHCISEWLHRNPVCPLCRRRLPATPTPEEDEDEDDFEDWEDGAIGDWDELEVGYYSDGRMRRRII